MPDYLKAMASSPDPVGITRNVVDNFYGALVHQEDQFKAAPDELSVEEIAEAYTAQMAKDANEHLRNIGTGKVKYNPDEVAEVHARHDQKILGVVLRNSVHPQSRTA